MIRYTVFVLVIIVALAAIVFYPSTLAMFVLVVSLPLVALGTYDCWQSKHAVYRNYPIIGHIRALFESIRPQIRQYLIESDTDGMPFDREERTLVYQRAKNVEDKKPFGTELNIYGDGYEWINHSIAPCDVEVAALRVVIGGDECSSPYSASLLNVSAMSYGSLGGNAVAALNKGAAIGGFAQDTGEGGISRFHREHGGDLIWEIGSGYFGCRNKDGSFDAGAFGELAKSSQVKMVELKLSQGAKPGQGGMLPGAKVTAEIAAARGVSIGSDCISPARHSTFSTPVEMLEFIAKMRELSGGKPAGFKLCIGHPWEIMAIAKAMLSTGILPDFIVIDGSEGGTGAAPVEFSDHIGMPLREGLVLAHNVLLGCGLRDKIRIGASGKVVSGFNIAANIALGADWCNSARGFMFSLGCIQSQHCHKGNCPTGIATHDKLRQAGLNVETKALQVAEFHKESLKVLSKIIGAAGLTSSSDLNPEHLMIRQDTDSVLSAKQMYRYLAAGSLLSNTPVPEPYSQHWERSSAERFQLT
ncbi:MAG: FMN-binding glutamate synthase family protein [Pseudomonadales bacterium]